MSKKILFVDDDELVCQAVVASMPDYDFTYCTCPFQALELMKTGNFSIVFTDLVMERMDGNSLCCEIIKRYPNIPVILITGYPSFKAAVTSMEAGAHQFLTKPFTKEELEETINSL